MCAVYSITNYARRSTQTLNKITYRRVGAERYGIVKQVLRTLLGTFVFLLKKRSVSVFSAQKIRIYYEESYN
jgi:hypothetical protein